MAREPHIPIQVGTIFPAIRKARDRDIQSILLDPESVLSSELNISRPGHFKRPLTEGNLDGMQSHIGHGGYVLFEVVVEFTPIPIAKRVEVDAGYMKGLRIGPVLPGCMDIGMVMLNDHGISRFRLQ